MPNPRAGLYPRVDTLRQPCDGTCARPEAAATKVHPLVDANTEIRVVGVVLGFCLLKSPCTLTRADGRTKKIMEKRIRMITSNSRLRCRCRTRLVEMNKGNDNGVQGKTFSFFLAQQPLVGQGHLIVEASRSHSDTAHSARLLWTSDQLVAETSA